jgi:hypothetical protein
VTAIRCGARPLVGVLVPLLVVALLGAPSAASGGGDPKPDLRAAVFTGGACGTFGDSLPLLVTRANLRPGDVAGDVSVCLKVVGDDGRQLRLTVGELVDVDASCTGDEGTLDRSCGAMGRGELAASLIQQVGVAQCSDKPPPTDPALDRRLPSLRDEALTLMSRLRRGELACVRLVLVYQVTDPTAAVVSQSDRVTWRYAFSVS